VVIEFIARHIDTTHGMPTTDLTVTSVDGAFAVDSTWMHTGIALPWVLSPAVFWWFPEWKFQRAKVLESQWIGQGAKRLWIHGSVLIFTMSLQQFWKKIY